MLWTVAITMIVLWALGLISSYTFGGFIHILLVAGLIVIIYRLIADKNSKES